MCPLSHDAAHQLSNCSRWRAKRSTWPPSCEALLLASLARTYLPAVLHLCPAIDDARRLAALLDFN